MDGGKFSIESRGIRRWRIAIEKVVGRYNGGYQRRKVVVAVAGSSKADGGDGGCRLSIERGRVRGVGGYGEKSGRGKIRVLPFLK